MVVQGYFLKKTEVLYAELNKRVEAATSSNMQIFTIYLFCTCDEESSEHPIKVFGS